MKSFIVLVLMLSFNYAQAAEGDVEIKIPSFEYGPVGFGIYKYAPGILFHRVADKLEITIEGKGRQLSPVIFRKSGSLTVKGSAQALDKLAACLNPQPKLDKRRKALMMTTPVRLNFSGSNIGSDTRVLELPEAFSCSAL